jgi:hypothetical protein
MRASDLPLPSFPLPGRFRYGPHEALTLSEWFYEHLIDSAVYLAGAFTMDRNQHEELDRRLAQARRLALEPHDPLTRGRLAELIKELELKLQDQRKVA